MIALGGSVIKQYISDLDQLTQALQTEEQLVIVCGAGHLKKHIEAVREHTNKSETDLVGIAATRFNARTVQTLLNDSHPSIPETVEEVRQAVTTGKDVVMGGLNPGFSTDAVAAVVAELLEADLYIVTDIDGIYSKDPSENPDAEKFDEISTERLLEMTEGKNEPGVYSIVDETAVQIVERSNIGAKLLEGKLQNIQNLEKSDGTDIVSTAKRQKPL